MPSRRGRFSHGRDKDERFMHVYNEGWQWWWLYVILLGACLITFAVGFGVATVVHSSDYDRGYRDGKNSVDVRPSPGNNGGSSSDTSTTTSTVPEPSPASPGSGAPAADTQPPSPGGGSAAPAPPVPVPFVQHTG